MKSFFETMANAEFLLFMLGIYWKDIAGYIQSVIVACNPELFGFASAIIIFFIIRKSYHENK